MRKFALFLLAVVFFAVTAQASDVAEAAKKEKARRDAIQKQGKPARVLTNQDIANLKATLAFEASEPAETDSEEPAQQRVAPAVVEAAPVVSEPEDSEEVARLKEEREVLEQQAKDAQQTIDQGGGYHTRNIGNQYKIKREAEERIREIDEKLNEANEPQ